MNEGGDRIPAVVIRRLTRGRYTAFNASCSVCGRVRECPNKVRMRDAANHHIAYEHAGVGRIVDLDRDRPFVTPPP